MQKKMSRKAKAITVVATLLALCAVVALVIVFATGGCRDKSLSNGSNPISDQASSQIDDSQTVANGDTVYDYNDLATAIADVPRKEALDEIYVLLEGYWVTQGDPFVGFFINSKGEHEVEYGLYQSGFGGRGKIVGGNATGTYQTTLYVLFPAVPANEMDGARPESTETFYLDIGGLYQPGSTTIKVKTESLGIGGWYTYQPGGSTLQQAFENR